MKCIIVIKKEIKIIIKMIYENENTMISKYKIEYKTNYLSILFDLDKGVSKFISRYLKYIMKVSYF